MEEIWRDIQGYEGHYQVSNLGRVRSLKNNSIKILIGTCAGIGYTTIALCKNGKPKTFAVHRLVAQAFLPNPNNWPEINHKDENKSNNCADNLEWCEHSYNMAYGSRTEKQAKSRSVPIIQYDLEGNFIKEWKSAKEVERAGIAKYGTYITKACRLNREFNGSMWIYK